MARQGQHVWRPPGGLTAIRSFAVAAALCSGMLLAACGGGGGAPAAQSTAAASPTPSPAPAFTPRTIDIELMPIAGSAYHGSARITTTAGGYTVSITLSGLTAGSKHLVNFHPGTCAAIDSGNGQDVGYLTADSSGSFSQEVNINAVPGGSVAIRIISTAPTTKEAITVDLNLKS